jgi:hypothetical protein
MKISRKVKKIFSFIGIADLIASALIGIASVEAWNFTAMHHIGVCAVLGIICLTISGAFEM